MLIRSSQKCMSLVTDHEEIKKIPVAMIQASELRINMISSLII